MDTNECRSSRGVHAAPSRASLVIFWNSFRTCQRSSGVPSSRQNTRSDCHASPAASRSAAWRVRWARSAWTCPARKQDSAGDLQVIRGSGGVRVLVDQAAQDGFSADVLCADVDRGGAGASCSPSVTRWADALVRPGHLVVGLVVGQDGAQMPLAEDQHADEEFAAQGAGEAFADRVHVRRLDGGAQDPGAGGLEDGVEGAGEVRSAVADEEPDVLEPLAEAHAEIAGLLHRPFTGGVGGDAAEMHPARAVLDENQDVQPL